MAASYQIDLVDGADYQRQYGFDGHNQESATRVALVYGLTAGSASATALLDARVLVEALVPAGTPYNVAKAPNCVAYGYRAEGLSDNDDAVRVRILYSTPTLQAGGTSVVWMVDDDTTEISEPTQIDPATGDPLRLTWKNPNQDPATAQSKTDIATIGGGTNVNRLLLTCVMPVAQLQSYRDIVNSVNQAPYKSYPKGHWKFSRFSSTNRRGATQAQCSVELTGKKSEDWSQYEIYRDPDGKYVLPPAGVVAAARAAEYVYGSSGRTYNGILKVGRFPLADFTSKFATLT